MDKPSIPQPAPAHNLRRRYPLITGTGFANPSTDWDAYWIGFIAADGGIHGNMLRIRLAARDVDHLYTFRAGMRLENPVRVVPNGGYPAAQIEVSSAQLVADLARWGVTPRKGLVQPFPADFPAPLLPAFLRGYFDGNGTIMWRTRVTSAGNNWQEVVLRFSLGSPAFFEGLQCALAAYHIQMNHPYRGTGAARVLPIATSDGNARRFAALLYTGATIYLHRKYIQFQPLLEEAK